MLTIQRLPVPVIARVQGHRDRGRLPARRCLRSRSRGRGGARFAVSGASTSGCSAPRRASRCRATSVARPRFEMLVTGAFISADEARAKGLINRVVGHRGGSTPRSRRWSVRSSPSPRVAIAMGKGPLLPPARDRRRRRLRRCRPDHGLQHDGCLGPRGRAGLHRQAPARTGRASRPVRRTTALTTD